MSSALEKKTVIIIMSSLLCCDFRLDLLVSTGACHEVCLQMLALTRVAQ